MSKVSDYSVMDLDPEDMPQFLNDLAQEYFEDNFDVRMQLSQCSIYIHTLNKFLNKKSGSTS